MNREATTPVSSVHPVYPSLRDSCDVIHIDGKGKERVRICNFNLPLVFA